MAKVCWCVGDYEYKYKCYIQLDSRMFPIDSTELGVSLQCFRPEALSRQCVMFLFVS